MRNMAEAYGKPDFVPSDEEVKGRETQFARPVVRSMPCNPDKPGPNPGVGLHKLSLPNIESGARGLGVGAAG